jgi:hypothetical protein
MSAQGVALDISEEDEPVVRAVISVLENSRRRSESSGAKRHQPSFKLTDLRMELLKEKAFCDPSRLLQKLKRRGLIEEVASPKGDKTFIPTSSEDLMSVLRGEVERMGRDDVSPFPEPSNEASEIRDMDTEFFLYLKDLLNDRLEEVLAFGKEFTLKKLVDYSKKLFGETLYLDIVIALLHQYALADARMIAPTGRATGTGGFNLALFGPAGTGKTFAIDDMIRGNEKSGVPPHGLPGRNRYCGGITPAQFLRVGTFYRGRTFNFIVPEFNDWFKYRGMVEPLKLVMEQRPVKWETTLGTIGPYVFTSYFSVNYNVRVEGGNDYWATIADPNFSALEDRMLLRFHTMTRERFRAVEGSAERLELGKLDFSDASLIRDHMTLLHAIETGHPLTRKWKAKGVSLSPKLYETLRAVSEKALAKTASPKFSPRLKSRAVKLAAAGALVGYFTHAEDEIPVGREEEDLARIFYEQEISAREGQHPSHYHY